MSRQDRVEQYANPQRGPHGAGRDQKNLDYWADRAKENSQLAPRASNGAMKLPSTGKMGTRGSDMAPMVSRGTEARIKAMEDTNIAGSDTYMPGVRRNA